MRKLTILTVAGVLAYPSAWANLIDFEQLSKDESPIPDHYGGVNWSNFYSLYGALDIPGSGFETGIHSGQVVTYNAYANPAFITGASFNFNSAYLTAAWNDGLQVKVLGFKDNIQIDEKIVTVNPSASTFVQFNFDGVDTVRFESSGGTRAADAQGIGACFVMDDADITITSVPDSGATISLLVGGLGTLMALGRVAKTRKWLNLLRP